MTDGPTSPREVTQEQVRAVLNSDALVCDVDIVAAALGSTRWSYYALVQRGDAPIMPIKLGRRQKYLVSDLRKLLGIEPDPPNHRPGE